MAARVLNEENKKLLRGVGLREEGSGDFVNETTIKKGREPACNKEGKRTWSGTINSRQRQTQKGVLFYSEPHQS